MQVKKNPKIDLEKKKGLFLEIGLVVALLLCIIMFGVSQKEKVVELMDLGGIADEIEVIDVTQEETKPETPPEKQTVAVIADILNVVKNDTKITTTFEFVDYDEDIVVDIIELTSEEIEEDAPFIIAEEMPTFMGGDLSKFRAWVLERFRYPAIAQENGIQGRVVLQFIIERDGTLTNITVLQTPDRILSDEAVRVLSTSPKWAPGKQRNMPVRVKYTLPVEFKIN